MRNFKQGDRDAENIVSMYSADHVFFLLPLFTIGHTLENALKENYLGTSLSVAK